MSSSLEKEFLAVPDNVPVDGEKKRSGTTIILSLEKGIKIFEHVLAANRPLKLQEVATYFDIDKSSALRFLATLERGKLIDKHPVTKTYSVGPKLGIWSRQLRSSTSLVEVARPFLKRLSTETKQTSHLAVLQQDRVVLIEVMEADNVVSVRQTPGDWEPLYCTAVGKAILGFLPEAERNRLIDHMTFRGLTQTTLTTPGLLKAELQTVTAQAVAFDNCENKDQLCCIAAPIFDASGYPVGSIGVSMISPLFPDGPRAQTQFIQAVQKNASEITDVLSRK